MDYEKAYKEALAKCKAYIDDTQKRWSEEFCKATEEVFFEIFPELKESEDEKIRKAQLDYWRSVGGKEWHGVPVQKTIAWLEKHGAQKPIDKVEPKFKEGDWVVNNDSGDVFQVTEIRDDEYCIWPLDAEIMGYLRIIDVDNDYHLYTIQDAKDGDVLCYKDEIFIYKHDIKNCTEKETSFGGMVYYCCYDGKRFITDSMYSLTEKDKDDIHPATKEQRDLLFQKMKETGYVWDEEKKELKRIEQVDDLDAELKESEGERIRKQILNYFVVQKINEPHPAFDSWIAWIEKQGKKKNVDVESLAKTILASHGDPFKKSKWTEEDSLMIDSIVDTIKWLEGKGATNMKIDWLKSLKQRMEE